MKSRIINLSPRISDNVDYNMLIFVFETKNILDMDRSDQMWVFLKTVIQGGAVKIILEMKDLEFIDSIGIGVIINAAKMIRNKKGDIALLNVPERVEHIFKPVNLNRFVKFFASEQDAVNYFRLV
jgi:anti-anti-sigma factor